VSVVRSDGGLVAIERAPQAPRSGSLPMYGDAFRQLFTDPAELWRTQPAIRTVVSFLGRNIAQLGLHTFKRISDTDRERVVDHALPRLLGRPNPSVTWYRLADALVQDMGIYDAAYWLKVWASTGQMGLIRIPPVRVTPIGDSWLTPQAFKVRGNRGSVTYPADQVVHFHGYNPTLLTEGLTPMQTLRRILAEDVASGEYREWFWRNAARVEGVIERPADAPEWSDEARGRFRAEWQALHSGAANSGATGILEEGMTFNSTSFNAKDSQYVEARKLSREEVAAAYHVPLPMVGILEHATFSNIREQHKQLYQDTLGPWLEMIQQEIELQLVPDVAGSAGLYVEFNLAEKLKGSFEEQATSLQASVGGPVMTRNEGRARLNLPYIEGGDELILPLNLALPSDGESADKPRTPEELAALINALGVLVRSGFDPVSCCQALGLDPIKHLGLLPVTVQSEEGA
jgi:HK97 family phage portal protein